MEKEDRRSRTELCIRMLQYLNTGAIFSVSQLAGLLDTKPRNIIEYKQVLDQIAEGNDIYIRTIPGGHGGYKLDGNITLPSLQLTTKEKEALMESFDFVMNKKDFPKKKDYLDAFSKIVSNVKIENKSNDMIMAQNYQLSMSEEEIQQRYNFIEYAIQKTQSIEIDYLSLQKGQKVHQLDPYKLYNYNNSWFFLAWNPEVGDVWSFKLNRIKSYRLLDKKFRVKRDFNPRDYIENNGFKNNGEYHHIVLTATGTRAMLLKERIYGKNQVVTDLEDGGVKVEVDMQNESMILSFALGCGIEATFLEPEWLVSKIKDTIKELSQRYEDK